MQLLPHELVLTFAVLLMWLLAVGYFISTVMATFIGARPVSALIPQSDVLEEEPQRSRKSSYVSLASSARRPKLNRGVSSQSQTLEARSCRLLVNSLQRWTSDLALHHGRYAWKLITHGLLQHHQ